MPGLKSLVPVRTILETVPHKLKIDTAITVETKDACCLYLAEDVKALHDVPPVDKAVLDGFAVSTEDLEEASEVSPARLEICEQYEPGCAVPVNTGDPLPQGTDTVVPIEACKVLGNEVLVFKAFPPGNAISKKGEDLKKGDVIAPRGTYIRPWHVAAMLSQGITNVRVFKPRVALAATGSELEEPWEDKGKVKNTTAWLVYNFFKERLGVEPDYFGILEDEEERIKKYFKERLEDGYDIIITTGGTSVGRRDYSAKALKEVSEFHVHGVALTPGRPLALGVKDSKLLVALSGYPVAALSELEVVIWPIVVKTLGLKEPPRPKVKGYLTRRLPVQPNMVHVYRVKVCSENNKLYVEPLRLTGSGVLSSLLKGNGILIAGLRGETGYDENTLVEVELIGNVVECGARENEGGRP